ncbi:recombinase family protein [Agrococcus casei]|uniref:recombinase family protein n=1 Tax=Agrococcus casei TaxID=343512 RepID=UPI003F8DA788
MSIRPIASAQPARRGLGLIRVSKDRDGLTSPDVQRHAIEQCAADRGIEIVDWVEGIDESGSSRNSAWWPRLDQSIGRMEQGDVDTILVWKFSRIGRARLKWAIALDRVDTLGGQIVAATEPIESATASGRFARGMLGEMNAYQAELIGETWREAHARRIRAGLPPTGGPRFGYTRADDGTYTPDPDTGPVLAHLYRLYLGGMGTAQLTRWLNDRGILGDRERWTFQGVGRMLDAGFGAGLLGRTEVRAGKRRIPPPWERSYEPGIHEPVIDHDTWRAYVARRKASSGRRTRARSPYLLTGLLRCGDCGGRMHGKFTDGRATYTCSTASTTTGVRKVSVVAWRVDQYVEQWLFSYSADADAQIAARARGTARRRDSEFITRRAHARLAKADERLSSLTIKLVDGTISDDAYKIAAEAIRADRASAEEALQQAAPNPVEEQAVTPPRDLAALWPDISTEHRALLLRPLVDHVVVDPARYRGDVADRFRVVPSWEVGS